MIASNKDHLAIFGELSGVENFGTLDAYNIPRVYQPELLTGIS